MGQRDGDAYSGLVLFYIEGGQRIIDNFFVLLVFGSFNFFVFCWNVFSLCFVGMTSFFFTQSSIKKIRIMGQTCCSTNTVHPLEFTGVATPPNKAEVAATEAKIRHTRQIGMQRGYGSDDINHTPDMFKQPREHPTKSSMTGWVVPSTDDAPDVSNPVMVAPPLARKVWSTSNKKKSSKRIQW